MVDILLETFINGFKENGTFYFEKRRQLPGEFFSIYSLFGAKTL